MDAIAAPIHKGCHAFIAIHVLAVPQPASSLADQRTSSGFWPAWSCSVSNLGTVSSEAAAIMRGANQCPVSHAMPRPAHRSAGAVSSSTTTPRLPLGTLHSLLCSSLHGIDGLCRIKTRFFVCEGRAACNAHDASACVSCQEHLRIATAAPQAAVSTECSPASCPGVSYTHSSGF